MEKGKRKPIIIPLRPLSVETDAKDEERTFDMKGLKKAVYQACRTTGCTWHWRTLRLFIDWLFDTDDTRTFDELMKGKDV